MAKEIVKHKKEKTGCWIWDGALRGKCGYGAIKHNGKTYNVHRLAYQLEKGEIPDGKMVSHKCKNKLCVNPEHLFLATKKDLPQRKPVSIKKRVSKPVDPQIALAITERKISLKMISIRFGITYGSVRHIKNKLSA